MRPAPAVPLWVKLGLAMVSALAGAAVGLIATFAHQSLPPLGIVLALGTAGLLLIGLRLWAPSRAAVGGAAAGLVTVSAILALPMSGSNIVVPANPVGYTWLIGLMVLATMTVAWPRIQRVPRRPATTMETANEQKEAPAP